MIRGMFIVLSIVLLSACGPLNEFNEVDGATPREWATSFSVSEYYCDGPDLEHRLLPCSAPVTSLSITKRMPDQVCLYVHGEFPQLPWMCLSGYVHASSNLEVMLKENGSGFEFLRQHTLMNPGPYQKLRMTLRKIDSRWVLIEDAQEGRLEQLGRRQVLYMILEKS